MTTSHRLTSEKNQYRFQAAKRLTAQVSDTAVRERLLEMAEE